VSETPRRRSAGANFLRRYELPTRRANSSSLTVSIIVKCYATRAQTKPNQTQYQQVGFYARERERGIES